jgi:hypothetical protein
MSHGVVEVELMRSQGDVAVAHDVVEVESVLT